MQNTSYGKLSPEVRAKLEQLEKEQPAYKQLTYLSDMADILQELLFVVDSTKSEQGKNLKDIGTLLTDARLQLLALNSKDSPDHSSPVVEAVRGLSKQLSGEIAKLKFNPEITVAAPIIPDIKVPKPSVDVSVAAPDLSKLEKLLKAELPKAFTSAVAAFPTTDNGAVLEALQTLAEWLESIDHAARMKPTFPNSMAVTGVVESSSPTQATRLDDTSTANTVYIGKAPVNATNSTAVWQIAKLDTSSGLSKTWAGSAGFTQVWDDRTILTYS